MNIEYEKIVFYDGDCGFCNRSVAFVLKNDNSKTIHFASIQSEFSQNLFLKNNWSKPDLSTFYYYSNNSLYTKSTAAIKLSKNFSFPQSWISILIIIPKFMRDGVYNFISKRRHRLSKGYCFVPNLNDKKRFID